MPVPEVVPQLPPRPEGEPVAAPPRPAVKVRRWALRPLGRKLNFLGILGAILALVGLVMPWWTETATVPVMGLGNSTAVDLPLYLYETSANVLANPPTRVLTLDLWFCWAALGLAALAALWAIVGSAVSGKGKWILVIGGVVALLSVVVFAAGLQSELSRIGSGLDLFTAASGAWGALTTYPSFGFWGAIVAAAVMLVAARRSAVVRSLPPATVQARAPEVASAEPHVRRPPGVTLLAAYCGILGICAIASAPFTSSLLEGFHQLSIGGLDLTYLWVLLVLSAVVDFAIAYGLLKRKKLARIMVRVLSGLAVVAALIVIGLLAVLVISPDLLGAGSSVSLMNSNATALYGGLALVTLLGMIVPVAVFWYMARRRVKEYFGIAELQL